MSKQKDIIKKILLIGFGLLVLILVGIILYKNIYKNDSSSYDNGSLINSVNETQSDPYDNGSLINSINKTQSETRKRLEKASTKILGTKETPLYIIENFLTHQECDKIVNEFKGKLVKSPLTRQDPNDLAFRTSTTGYFNKKDGIQGIIENRLLNLIGQDPKIAETSQMQHYEVGQEFKAHYDWFDPQADPNFYIKGQRTWTTTIYCNDVLEGGETYFTKLKIGVTPKKGQLVAWYNLTDKLKGDMNTMHRGTPVRKGYKDIITKWFKLAQNPD